MFIQVVTFLSVLVVDGVQSTNNALFVEEEMCNLQKSINQGCSKAVSGTRGKLECIVLCWNDTECLGASLDATGMCVHHQLCHFSVPCPGAPDANNRHLSMTPYCLHGSWDSLSKSCICRYETFGERCNNYQNSCDNLALSGFVHGDYWVILDPLNNGRDLIKVNCRIKRPGYPYYSQVKLVHNSGGFHVNRTWQEYVNGFMTDEKNFWAGLRTWHILGKAGLTHLDVILKFYSGGGKVLAHYEYFLVSGKDNRYSFSCSFQYSTCNRCNILDNSSDCLSSLQGLPFSTWDKNRQVGVSGTAMGDNCASLAGSGWWYKQDCHNPCQLLGWGLDNYVATPPAQRLTFLGLDVTIFHDTVLEVRMQLWKEKN